MTALVVLVLLVVVSIFWFLAGYLHAGGKNPNKFACATHNVTVASNDKEAVEEFRRNHESAYQHRR